MLCSAAFLLVATSRTVHAEVNSDLHQQLQLLQQQNAELKEQLREQRALIDGLTEKVGEMQRSTARPDAENVAVPSDESGFKLGRVHISGEGGVGFYDTGDEGTSPNSEFRVDEAKLFVESPIWGDVYFFSEINLAQRESDSLDVQLGELYLDFEEVSQLWGRDRMLNLRIGRLDIPFGEEYLERDAIDNPLISHSLSDLWGVDEGVEIYGSMGKFSYVLAVQNGSVSGTHDYNCDKSVTLRLAYDPTHWLHLSLSGMRTGKLDAEDDSLSELWFGSGWFRSIGGTNASTFYANLVEGDVQLNFSRGSLKAFGGYIRYGDNDPDANNGRDIYYYSVEGLFKVTRKFYAASRVSQIFVGDGYPIGGYGELGDYFFTYDPAKWTTDILRWSLGLGYRFSDNLLVKAEYSYEWGKEVSNEHRDDHLVAAEAAFKF